MNEFTKKYEGNISQPYSELGTESEDPDIWGNVEYQGKMVNIYNNPIVINDLFTRVAKGCVLNKDEIFVGADLGGSEGIVAETIQRQLRTEGYDEAHVINYELLSKSLELMQSKYPDVIGVQADLRHLPINRASIDFAALRYVLPYLSGEEQKQVLKNAFSALKNKGKLVILQDGGFDQEKGRLYNQLFAESSSAQSGIPIEQVSANRCFSSAEELCQIAEEVGFGIDQARDLSDALKGYLSPEAYASRFNMSAEQLYNLQEVYKRWKEEGRLEFSDDLENPDNVRVKRPTIYLVLKKITSEMNTKQ